MANPSKAKGTRAETKVVNYLKAHGIEAKRKALSGNKDQGDIQVGEDVTLEVKTGKMTACYNRTQLTEWLRQAFVEGVNSNQNCYLVIVRYGRRIQDAEVWRYESIYPRTMFMSYLDEFVKYLK